MKSQIVRKFYEILQYPLFVIFLLNLVFFSKVIYSNLILSPSDILQIFPSFNLGTFYAPKNSLLFDPVTQFQSWYLYAGRLIISGQIPIWNDLNAGGVPFFANQQSALLFPLSFFFYIFDFKIASFLFYFTKLFSIGVLTYLFLRELGLKKTSALVGATAFNFAGFTILWFLWPQTNVVVLFPLLMLITEKYMNKKFSSIKIFVFFSVSILFIFTAGHPETLVQVLLVVISYFVFRLITSYKSAIVRTAKIKVLILSIFTGLLLSGLILIPFSEYLLNSYELYSRTGINHTVLLPIITFIYNIFPNISGNPSGIFYHALAGLNYNEVVSGYTGIIILICAALSLFAIKVINNKYLYFILLTLFVLPFIYNIPLLSNFASIINQLIGNTRLLFVFAFSVSVLASFFVEYLSNIKYIRKTLTVLFILTIIVGLLSVLIIPIITQYLSHSYSLDKVIGFLVYEKSQIYFLLITTLIGLFALFILSRNNSNKILGLVLVFTVYLQTGFLNLNYNPLIEQDYFYPNSPAVLKLQSLPSGRYLELGGNQIIPPDVNLAYNLKNVRNYDALDIRDYKILFDKSFPNKNFWNEITSADPSNLNLFGVKYILSYTDIDNEIVNNQDKAINLKGEMLPEVSLTSDFVAKNNNLYSIRVLPANYNRLNNCYFTFTLSDDQGHHLFTQNFDCKNVFDKVYFQIDFPQIINSKGKHYKFSLEVPNAKSGDTISFWQGGNNDITFQTLYNIKSYSNLNLIYDGEFKIYENTKALPEYYINDNSESDIESLTLLEDSSVYKKMIVNLSKNSMVYSTNAYYPGWIGYIDSQPANLVKFKNAFQGLAVPGGKHTLEIVYDPVSFKLGGLFSILGLVLLLIIPIKLRKYDKK